MLEIRHAVPGCGLEDALSEAADTDRCPVAWQLHWLGQAGFALLHGHLALLIDPYHFGMFAENTIDEAELERKIAALKEVPVCVKPVVGQCLEVVKRRNA